ncbi:hypothetical protein ACOMHN_020756 [Nucella lapillus]
MSNFDSVLKTYFSTYKNPDVAKRDVSQTLQLYRDLRPSVEPFVFNDGSTQRLVQLDGTIPVPYKGNLYNIPIQLWVMDSHPYNPPIVYVRPTNNMQIRSGRYVDMNGKVDLPYLREWRSPRSDLLGLVQILIVTFGEECPVFSRVPARPPPPNAGQTPYPTTSNPHMPMPGMPQPGQGSQPPYPSYSPYPSYPNQSGTYPAQPPYPSAQGNAGYPPQGGYPPATSSYSSSQPNLYNPPYPNPQMAYSASQGTAAPTTYASRPSTGTVTEEHIRASLLSAVEDKMKRRLREFFAQAQAEMDVLKKTQTDLTSGKNKLEHMLRDLEQEKMTIESNMILLTTKDQEVKEALQRMEQGEKVDIDEAVVTTAPLYRQLIDSFAEEQAIEDAIYYLGEALRKNVIELEVFLKRVRELSRKQFMQRALIQKCREKAGLPPLV